VGGSERGGGAFVAAGRGSGDDGATGAGAETLPADRSRSSGMGNGVADFPALPASGGDDSAKAGSAGGDAD